LLSLSFLRLLALQKEEEEGDDNVAAIAFLRCNTIKEEEEGDDNIAAITFFVVQQ
jgi:hypothetical protein